MAVITLFFSKSLLTKQPNQQPLSQLSPAISKCGYHRMMDELDWSAIPSSVPLVIYFHRGFYGRSVQSAEIVSATGRRQREQQTSALVDALIYSSSVFLLPLTLEFRKERLGICHGSGMFASCSFYSFSSSLSSSSWWFRCYRCIIPSTIHCASFPMIIHFATGRVFCRAAWKGNRDDDNKRNSTTACRSTTNRGRRRESP